VLQKAPDHVDALHLLGVLASERGRHQRAIQLIRRALAIAPEFPAALANLGNALNALGKRTQAVDAYARAIALKPDYAIAHCNLATVQIAQGSLAAALASAERAIALAPNLLEAHLNRADALARLRRFEDAEATLRHAVAVTPERAMSHSRLGAVLAESGRFEEAIACHQRAIDWQPNDASLHCALGRTLSQAQDIKASEASLRRALSLDRNFAPAWHWLGETLLAAGRLEEAVSCLRRAIAIDPDFAAAHETLAYCGQRANAAQLRRVDALVADPDRILPERVAAGFAAGRFLDNAGQYEEAFPYLATANALQRQQLAEAGESFDAVAFGHEIDNLIARCPSTLFTAAAEWGNRSELPVFIVGVPRSGTSLVEQIVASHTHAFGGGERKDIAHISDVIRNYNHARPIEEWDVDFARRLADDHITKLKRLAPEALRITDKMPDNVLHLGTIAVLFPMARVIFCRRNICDTCLSLYFQRFEEGNAFSYDLADCARRFLEIERLAGHWRQVLPIRMLTVNYEAVVADPVGEGRRMIEFLGLEWEPGCREFHRTERPILSASVWQVRQPVFTRSVGRWRHYARHLQPLFATVPAGACAGERESQPE
jgi:tetratricopeptide (TPR) repeat protein